MNVIVIFSLLNSSTLTLLCGKIELNLCTFVIPTNDQNPSFVTPTGGRTHVLLTSITYIYSKSSYSLHIGLLDA